MPIIKLNIRWKYFLTLLVLCLFPLVVITLASHIGIKQLVETISQDTRDAFNDLSHRALLQTAQTQSLIYQRSRQAVEFALLDLSKEAQLVEKQGGSVPEAISKPMADILNAFPRMAKRVLVVGSSGVALVLHEGDDAPVAPDQETKDWIKEKLENSHEPGKVVWASPGFSSPGEPSHYTTLVFFGDAKTGKQMVALEISTLDKLNQGVTAAPWRDMTQSFLVASGIHPETGEPGLKILAQKKTGPGGWSGPEDEKWLTSSDQGQIRSILDSISRDGSGTKQFAHGEETCVWAWAPTGKGTCFVTLVPTSVVEIKSRQVAQILAGYTQSTLVLSGLAALATLLLVALAAFMGSRRFSRPLMEVIQGIAKVSRGDFSIRVNLKTGDEWDSLIQGFNRMVPMLEETMAWRKRLELAREVQQSLLPKSPPSVKGLDIAARSVSAQQVGGDYYDFLKANEEQRLTVAVGDITGHGVGAALLMTTARALVRRRSRRAGNLAKIIFDINKQLAPDVADSGKFMTLFLAEVDMNKMVVRWANAGHDPALIYDPTNDLFESLEGGGLILGPFENSVYEQYKRPISPGQIIILGTDGIWETMNFEGNYFGKESLNKVVAAHAHLPARDIVEQVFQALNTFRRPKRQEDDVTLVVIKVLEEGTEYKQLKLPELC
ncbi:MAG: SpoIIE family protein phosphatase [Desulfatibacillum sp.]|nr:SpoIIE family protein phosphatase [Desulfatibacillum sp.]